MGMKAPVTGGGMHSHDRTMIAKLGFADEDKRNGEHDLACQYLVDPEIAAQLVWSFGGRHFIEGICGRATELAGRKADPPSHELSRESMAILVGGDMSRFHVDDTTTPEISYLKAETEVPLLKGDGPYQTTLGFLDVRIDYRMTAKIRGDELIVRKVYEREEGVPEWRSPFHWEHRRQRFEEPYTIQDSFVIEVKVGRVGLGEAIRQLKFYRSFLGHPDPTFVLATRYELSGQETDLLSNEGLHHVHLGDGFTAWLEARRKEAAPSKTSIRL